MLPGFFGGLSWQDGIGRAAVGIGEDDLPVAIQLMGGPSRPRASGGGEMSIEPQDGKKKQEDHGSREEKCVAVGKKNLVHDGPPLDS